MIWCGLYLFKTQILAHCVPSQPNPRGSATLNQVKSRRSAAIERIQELEKIVENWDSKDLGQCCNEFIRGTVDRFVSVWFYPSSESFRGYAKQSEPKKTDRETGLPVRRVDGIVQEQHVV